MSDASPPTGTPTPVAPAPSRPASGQAGESPRTGPAFIAAGIMLAIMTAWIRYGGFDPPAAMPSLIVGLAAVAAFAWGAMRIVGKGTTTASAGLAAAGSIVLLGVAGWLGWSLGVESIGQAVGLALFAAIGFGVAVGWSGGSLRDRLPGSLPTRIALFLLAFAVLALAIYLRAVRNIGNEYLPEQLALFLLGFTLLFGAVWLYATTNRTSEFLTTFFVVLGSAVGAILTLYAMSRGVIDWSRLTAEPWRGWVVGYALVAGLGLIYSSLTLVESRAGASSVARQSIYGFATVFCGILAFAILVVFNIFIFRTVSTTMEWSKTRGLTSLSTASKNLLAGLDKKVEVYVLMSPQNFLHLQMKTMLDNAANFAPSKFAVTYINPDSSSDAERKKFDALANQFKEIISSGGREDQEMSRGVLLVYGPMPADPNTPVPHAVIPVRRLFDEQMKTFTFKGEAEVMKELDFLARKREKRKIYMLQGDNELDINEKQAIELTSPTVNLSRLGAGKLVENLTKDNYDVQGLSFRPANPDDKETNIVHVEPAAGKKAEVPDDCETLVILSPSTKLSAEALDAIERYLDRGGHLFAGIGLPAESDFSKLKETGLEGLLKKYGVDVTDQFVMHFATKQIPSYFIGIVEVPEKGETVLAQQFAGKPFAMVTPRIVKPGTTTKFKVEPLLIADPGFFIWAEDSLQMFRADPERILRERLGGKPAATMISKRPLPVAVTVTQDAKPRMVVVGSGEFLTNYAFRTEDGRNNYDLMVSSLAWMGERGFVGPRPIESSNYSLSREGNFAAMTIGSAWTLTALLIVIGGCIWIVRRR